MRRNLLILLAVLGLAALAAVLLSQPEAAVEGGPAVAPEAELAADEGGRIGRRARTEAFATVLDRLDPKCVEPRDSIAELARRHAASIAQKEQRDVTMLDFLNYLDEALPEGEPQVRCAGIAELMELSSGAGKR